MGGLELWPRQQLRCSETGYRESWQPRQHSAVAPGGRQARPTQGPSTLGATSRDSPSQANLAEFDGPASSALSALWLANCASRIVRGAGAREGLGARLGTATG